MRNGAADDMPGRGGAPAREEGGNRSEPQAGEAAAAEESLAHDRLVQDLYIHRAELAAQNEELRGSQAELEESRQRYLHMFEHAPVGYLLLTTTGVIRSLNHEAAQLCGEERGRLSSKPIYHAMPPESRSVVMQQLKASATQGETRHCEIRMYGPGRVLCWRRLDIAPFSNTSADRVFLVSMVDIDEQRRAQESLAKRELELRTLADHSQDLIARFSTRRKLLFSNRAFALLNRTGGDSAHPGGRASLLLEAAITQVLENDAEVSVQLPFEAPEKRIIHFRLSPEYGAMGGIASILAVGHDVTGRVEAEALLRRREAQYRMLTESVLDVISRHEWGGVCTYVSPSCEQQLGYAPEELIGANVYTLVDPADADALRGYIGSVTEGFSGTVEYRLRAKNNQWIWVETSARALTEGEVPELFCVTRNIMSRKQSEQALRGSEMQFKAIFNLALDVILIVEAPSGRILRANAMSRYVLRCDEKSLAGQYIHDFLPMAESLRAYGAGEAPRTDGPVFESVWFQRADGTEVPLDLTATVIPWEQKKAILVTLRDVSERTRAEEALRASEERWRSLVMHAPNFIAIIAASGEFAFINRTLCWAAEDMPGHTIFELFDARWRERISSALARVFAAEPRVTASFEASLARPCGPYLWFDCQMGQINPAGATPTAICILTDITGRKQAEQEAAERQKQLMEADKLLSLGTLVAGVAHEINNPNHQIMTNAQVLREAWEQARPILDAYHAEEGDFVLAGFEYPDFRERMDNLAMHVVNGAQRIDRIVKELRDYARQSREDRKSPVDMNQVVRSSTTLLGSTLGRYTHHFTMELGEDIPPVMGNFQRLEQVLINLIQNACEALREPGAAVGVNTEYDPDTKQVYVRVWDEGEGIDPAALPRVQDPFFTTKRERGGTGLGLSISASIVHEHQGRLELRPNPAGGATALLVLPEAEAMNSRQK